MAHVFMLPPRAQSYERENSRQKRPQHVEDMFSRRNSSISASSSSSPSHRNSALSAHRNPSTFSSPLPPPSDNDIIIVTVKLSNNFRRASLSGAEELPARPRPRSFLGRVKTRLNSGNWDHAAEREERYKAVKMPRGEYRKEFIRHEDGRRREWEEEEIERCFGRWQDLPLRSVVC